MGFQFDNSVGQGNTGALAGYNNYNSSGLKESAGLQETTAVQELQRLNPGKVFKGEITDIVNNKVTIRLDNGQTLQASMKEPMSFSIGDKVIFQIKSNDGATIEIRPLVNAQLEQNTTIIKALQAAGIPMNDKTLEMMQVLLREQMPIDKKSLMNFHKQMLANTSAMPETIIQLNKLNIPVTPENIGQMEAYKNYEHRIAAKAEQLSEQLPRLLEEFTTQNPKGAQSFHKQIIDLLLIQNSSLSKSEYGEAGVILGKQGVLLSEQDLQMTLPSDENEQAKATGGEKLAENSLLQDTIDHQADPNKPFREDAVGQVLNTSERGNLIKHLEDFNLPQQIKQQILSGELPIDKLLTYIQEKITSQESVFTDWDKLIQVEEYGKLLRNQISNQFFLRPEELLQEQKTQEFYEKIRQQTAQIERMLEQVEKTDTLVGKSAQGIRENIDFMNQINQMFNYIQLPLKLSGQNAHSDLYVFTNKKKLQEREGSLSALLHLDMEVLGSVDIYVEMNQQDVSLKFSLAGEEEVHLFAMHMAELTSRLEDRGYRIKTQVERSQKSVDFVEDFLGEEHTGLTMQRYSFDVRA